MRSLVIVCVVGLGLAACGDKYDSAAKETLSIMEDMVVVLENAKPGAGAVDLKAKLEPLAKKLQAAQERHKNLADPSAEREKELMEKYGKRQIEVMKRMSEAAEKHAGNPEIGEMLDNLMK